MADETWSTRDELNFLRNLGNHREVGKHPQSRSSRVSGRSLVSAYLFAIRHRKKWDMIDKAVVRSYAESLLTA